MKRGGAKSWFLRALVVFGVVTFLGLAWVGVELVRGPVIPVEEHGVVEQELVDPATLQNLTGRGTDRGEPAELLAGALEVELNLEEGRYEIGPGAPAGSVRLDANYDSANYEFSTKVVDREGRLPRYEVGFYRTTSALRSLMTTIHHEMVDNEVEVQLPEGVPIDLSLRLRRGEFRIDLSGLSIARLSVVGGMGEIHLAFDEQNPIEMSSLEVDAKMGELRMYGLGHADARRIDVRGRMGEFRVDFDGELRADSEVEVRVTMGEGQLHVPEGRGFELVDSSAMMGNVEVRRSNEAGSDPELVSPGRFLFDLGVRMGEITLR